MFFSLFSFFDKNNKGLLPNILDNNFDSDDDEKENIFNLITNENNS